MVKVKPRNPDELRLLIAKGGHTLCSFSEKIGISYSYLSQILNLKRTPSPIAAAKIAEGLSLELEDIFLIQNVAKDNL